VIRIAINGFGRIGRNFLRAVLQDDEATKKIEIVAINIGAARVSHVAHMFKYDTLMGTFPESVSMEDGMLQIGNRKITIIGELNPARINWSALGIHWVVECCGQFTCREDAAKHMESGAGCVLISAPAQDEDITIIPGVNDDAFDKKVCQIVSLGSCTTNALAPMLKVLHETFGIEHGFMTTVHAYTNAQVLLDVERKDVRRARAAALNIIPTTTGASSLLGKVLPELEGRIDGLAIRVPVAKVSLIDLTFIAQKDVSVDALRSAFIKASTGSMKNILGVTDEQLVSSDFNGDDRSVVIDMPLLQAHGKSGKVFGWYDNEWAYSVRLKDFLLMAAD